MDIFNAIEMDDLAAVSAFLAADPSLATALSSDGATPVLHAMYRQNDALARALAVQIAGGGGALSLAEAAAVDDIARVRAMLAAGEPIDGRTPDGYTPLQLAAFFGAPQAAADLIAAGANVNAVADNPMRIQPLHAATAGRHGEIATMLIAAGADVTAAQRHGWTPLHSAAHNGDAKLVAELLAAGAPTDVTNDDGRTPADVATDAGYPDMVS